MKFNLPKPSTQAAKMKQTRSGTLTIITVASVVVVFCLVASKTLLSDASHLHKVASGRQTAVSQLKANISAVSALSSQYQALNSQSTNIIGGTANGTGPNDGTNSQIILDALPSQYDFPGLTASVEKLLSLNGVKLSSISGTDNEAANIPNAVANPAPVAMNFSFSTTTTFNGVKKLINAFQTSIRPFHVVSIELDGTDSSLNISANINTYFQPAKSVSITNKGVQ